MTKSILVADDNLDIITSIELLLAEYDYIVSSVTTPVALLNIIKTSHFDLILMDLNYQLDSTSGQEGLTLLANIRDISDVPVVVMTGWATVELAITALQQGANDFIQKPWQNEHLVNSIETQLALSSSQQLSKKLTVENQHLRNKLEAMSCKVIAQSVPMKNLLAQIEQLRESNSSILLTGENGTGKTLLARYIHLHSQRTQQPFVSINMGAVADGVFESELFGHKKGAFTGALGNRKGRFELAQHGTLFLDEIGNTPLSQQAKLLSVIEEKTFTPVGDNQIHNADIRIICATNVNLANAIAEGQFRQDLFYRLNTIELHIPSLRERKEDIVPLVENMLEKLIDEHDFAPIRLSSAAMEKLQNHHWPGNIRELNHCIERAVFMSQNNVIDAQHLHIIQDIQASQGPLSDSQALPIDLTLDELERQAIIERLKYFSGNVKKTATSLGLSRSGYYRRIEKFNL
ncbi:sigma-54 dependent transcriptional regulator [Pseudoalteromonas sp. MMG012]|uniref:sigma-54-dependent transcriptional regulator n=1 Tax=Pseudoalteromonas sp. MMG012 TaxID=2822686 RepID=UPI001B39DBEC|nr:sigma-54 dependent transcriptional regulator [Pseudoalteromonas sp. MMG012]MBQ4850856.1 sigma-54-dependent Fis family transcriptional regulator [Pseudoalteromonas sp. MMG012]